MKIKTKLFLVVIFSALAMTVLTVFLYFSFQSFSRAIEKNRTANQISASLFERRLLLDEYSLFGEKRPQEQWFAESDNIIDLIKSKSYFFTKNYEKKDINSILDAIDLTKKDFQDLLTINGSNDINSIDTGTLKEQKKLRLLAQLINQSQEANDAVNRLAVASSAEAVDAQSVSLYFWVGYIAVSFLIMFVGLWIWRGIAGSIIKLHKGTEVIGEGNLDFKVGTPVKDEVGQLSRAFDEMVDKLKVSYLNLEKDVWVLAESKKDVEEKNKELQDKIGDLATAREAILNVAEDAAEEEQKTIEEKNKIDAIIHSIGEGIVATDQDGKIILMNNMAEQLLGVDAKQVVGKMLFNAWKVFDEKGNLIPEEKRPLTVALKGKTTTTTNGPSYFYTKKDGTTFPVAIVATPVLSGNKIIGAIDAFRDITKEREIDKAKTEFVSLSAHQLRTPITAVKWYSEMLLDKKNGKLNEKQLRYLTEIYRGNEREVKLIDNMLNISRIEMGGIPIKNELVDAKKLFKNIIDEQKSEIVKRKHKLIVSQPAEALGIFTDPSLLTMILQNFLSNAVKYTLDKGIITCMIKKVDSKVLFSVADSGVGIPKNEQKRIFEKLFRASTSLELDKTGNGLGLYIAKEIAISLGGKIWFESELGKGTTFYVELPINNKA